VKTRIWGLIVFNVSALYAITHVASFALIRALVLVLLIANILFAFMFRRRKSRENDSNDRVLVMLHWSNWTHYIPLLGGIVCVLIGVVEGTWKPCVIGAVAIAVGVFRIWSRRVQGGWPRSRL